MPKICYIAKKFGADRTDKIDKANAIIEEYKAQGYELTLRQIYYQFVSRDFIPNNQREYKNLGEILNDARNAGLVDWDAMVDRTRNLKSLAHWTQPGDIIQACADQFRLDHWQGQTYRPEVWIEKDALVGVIERVCEENDVPFFSCRGYTSQSELWGAAMRLKRHAERGQTPIVFHFGDHDPSGVDMSRDITDRLALYAGFEVEVRRLALNMPQVKQYDPPPNPAKLTDSRCEGYIREHGDECWELDALEPKVINDLISTELHGIRDKAQWQRIAKAQKSHRKDLQQVAKRWEEIVEEL